MGEDVKKKLRFLREERLSPHEVKPDGFVDHFFAKKMVGIARFELATFCPPDKRANQAALHPDLLAYNIP